MVNHTGRLIYMKPLADFIVDACNAAEQVHHLLTRDMDRADSPEEARLRALTDEYQPSERGLNVLHDMAMQPEHNPALFNKG